MSRNSFQLLFLLWVSSTRSELVIFSPLSPPASNNRERVCAPRLFFLFFFRLCYILGRQIQGRCQRPILPCCDRIYSELWLLFLHWCLAALERLFSAVYRDNSMETSSFLYRHPIPTQISCYIGLVQMCTSDRELETSVIMRTFR